MAAPIPREAPVTRATPSAHGRLLASGSSPLDHAGAPGEAGAEGGEQDAGAGGAAGRRARPRPARAGSSRRRCCRSARCSRRRARASRLEPLADGAQDAPVRLVEDEEVDLVEARPARGSASRGRLGEPLDGGAEGLVALHPDAPRRAGRVISPARAPSAPQDRGAEARRRGGRPSARRRRRRRRAPRCGGRRGRVNRRHQVGADDEHVAARPASIWRGGEAERGDEARCRPRRRRSAGARGAERAAPRAAPRSA